MSIEQRHHEAIAELAAAKARIAVLELENKRLQKALDKTAGRIHPKLLKDR